eukprot:5397192-Alexandrium_andersonii.AAC.1
MGKSRTPPTTPRQVSDVKPAGQAAVSPKGEEAKVSREEDRRRMPPPPEAPVRVSSPAGGSARSATPSPSSSPRRANGEPKGR